MPLQLGGASPKPRRGHDSIGLSLVSSGQVFYRLTSPHSRNWLAKLTLAYSEQYTPTHNMSICIISLLKNHPAIICVRVLTFSIFHPRTFGILSQALFTEHCHNATATYSSNNCASSLLIVITFLSLLPCTSICKSQLRFVSFGIFTQIQLNKNSDS